MPSTRNLTACVIKGIAAAPGKVHGPVMFWEDQILEIPRRQTVDAAHESARLDRARDQSRVEIKALKEKVTQGVGEEESAVFDAHLMFMDDDALLEEVEHLLGDGLNAEAAWMDGVELFASQLDLIPDPTLAARAADVRDVGRRVLAHLLGVKYKAALIMHVPSIIIAKDLTPSQTAGLDRRFVLAFCTAEGGPTSHTAIISKALGIPAVVALGSAIMSAYEGEIALVNGDTGEVTLNPDEAAEQVFIRLAEEARNKRAVALSMALNPAITSDGKKVEVVANISGVEDARNALEKGAEGVGLFRTEFLYLEHDHLPDEEEQVRSYQEVFQIMRGRPIVVRTMDIGGDKAVSYLGIQQETNPFLGWRAIRMMNERPDVLISQFRALLRAGLGSDLRIMLPMVSSLKEIIQARALFDQAQRELENEKLEFVRVVEFGIMIEVPAAAILADRLAEYVDFFSIGTNDLTQYTLAVDRTNARVASLASPYDPAVLALIDRTIQAAHQHGKWVGLCGELAGDVAAVPILLGLGLDEFSMSAGSIPEVKAAIRRLSLADCTRFAGTVLACTTLEEVMQLLKNQ